MADTQQFKLLDAHGNIVAQGAAALETLPDTHARADALASMMRIAADAVEAEQTLEEARASAAKMICEMADSLSKRMDAYEEQLEARREREEEEAEREEQEEIERELDALPDPDDPHAFIPSGELHDLPPTVEDQGALPNELNKGAPPLSGTYPEPDPDKLAHPQETPPQRNPVGLSFM